MKNLTTISLIFLGFLAVFLIGIKVGTSIEKNINSTPSVTPSPSPTISPTPTTMPSPTIAEITPDKLTPTQTNVKGISTSTTTSGGVTTYTDRGCGFSFSYPGSYLNSKSANGEATIVTDPKDSNTAIAATCLSKVPRPPVSSDNIEAITLSGQPATLYHDKDREIVIVKNPTTQKEILLAGNNPLFSTILKSFKLL